MRLTDQLLALLVTFIWGTNFVLIEIGLLDFPPFTFAFLRFCLVVFPLVFFLPRPKISWTAIAAYGVLIGFGQFGLLFWAIRDNITPGLASLVVQIQVFFTVLMATALMGEKVRSIQWIALAISFVGLLVITQFSDGQTTMLGLGVVLVAAFNWAAGNMIVKVKRPDNILAFIVWSSIFAVPPLFAMSVYLDGSDAIIASIQNASWAGWGVVFWQSLGNTLIGYGLWNYLLGRYTAATVTPWALLVPVFGIAASALFLNEPLQLWKLTAAALIIFGLVLNLMSGRSAKWA